MVYLFKFPDVGEGIHEGTVVKVIVKEGQVVKTDEALFEVETDKAVVELPSPQTGSILKIYVKQGELIKVGQTIIAIGNQGESAPEKPDEAVPSAPTHSTPAKTAPVQVQSAQPAGESKAVATPAVRALAQKLGVNLDSIKGTGTGGRIMPSDVEAAAKTGPAPQAAPAKTQSKPIEFSGPVERTPLSAVRKAIADKITQSLSIPHAYVAEDIDMTRLYELREKLKKEKPDQKVSYLAFIVKAVTLSLQKHKPMNATFLGDSNEIAFKKYYNIGIAADTEHGLVVPVVKNADSKKITEITTEIEKLAIAARDRKISLNDLKDGTFTITNIGSIGGSAMSPIINHPEAAILGLTRMIDKPVMHEGRMVSRKIMRFDLGFDHRIVDGADAMRFLVELKEYIENPEKLTQYL